MFRIISNYSEIATCETLKEAKEIAVAESYKFDDIITVEKNNFKIYMAAYGTLYALLQLADKTN